MQGHAKCLTDIAYKFHAGYNFLHLQEFHIIGCAFML